MSSGKGSRDDLSTLALRAEERLGSTIADRYRLEGVLGVGGMGAVYKALHLFTDQRCALKLLHASVATSTTAAARFLREAKASNAIKHPAIVDVRDAGRASDGALYLAFELLEGQDLGAAIMERKVGTTMLVDIAVQVLEALQVAHDSGFVHRDIKPANIFLVPQDEGVRAKLLDFGIARRVEDQEEGPDRSDRSGLTQAGAVIGTPYYMSPEQMAGEKVDGRADLWALAVVMYITLTGQLPFKAKNYVALMAQMLSQGPPSVLSLRPSVPTGVARVVETALRPTLEQRYASASKMAQALRALQMTPAASSEPEPSTRGDSAAVQPTDVITGRRELVRSSSGVVTRSGSGAPLSGVKTPSPSPATDAGPTKVLSPAAKKPKEKWEEGLASLEGEIEALKSAQKSKPEKKRSGWLSGVFTGKKPK